MCAMMKEGAKRGKKKEEWGMCAFCRTPPASSNEESIKRIEKRVELDDASAICDLGVIILEVCMACLEIRPSH